MLYKAVSGDALNIDLDGWVEKSTKKYKYFHRELLLKGRDYLW